MNILDKLQQQYHQKLPFVVYKKPKEEELSGFFMKEDTMQYSEDYTESGFIFAPFNSKEKAVLFSDKKSEFISQKLQSKSVVIESKAKLFNETDQTRYITLIEKTIKKINESELKKIVISRKELVEFSDFDILKVFQKLITKYESAFVYVWYHPKVGLWLGATPETLLNVEENHFKTMSLAGTQVVNSSKTIVWGEKESDEQQLVTNFIKHQLKNISRNLVISPKETVKAGNLLHLKTKISGDFLPNSSLKEVVNALHPTPAVCGLPREEAKRFILENENYHREFYTGFLGEINLKQNSAAVKKTALFVNLRCMSIQKNSATIFVGGGITKDSDAPKEWEETVSKSLTMKMVLK